jgi:Phage portal protein, SPP1 Gp6-like
MIDDIKPALEKLKVNSAKYDLFEKYYQGIHDLTFATDKFTNAFGQLFRELALNMIPLVVDAPKDKLIVTEFSNESGDETAANDAWEIWQNNRLDVRSELVHKEALKKGDGYVIVWVDDKQKTTTIYPQKAENMAVFYDEETPGRIAWAAKMWIDNNKFTRINLYYPDKIEKYISKRKSANGTPGVKDFQPVAETPEIANPYNVVPVFHFPNNPDIAGMGTSESINAIPIQKALNKTVCDMLVASEFSSYKQRYASGIEVEYDELGNPKAPFMAGIERLWISESTESKFGEFSATDLKQFLDAKESFKMDIATVTGTPLHYFMQTSGQSPSGESQRRSETRFISKCKLKQSTFGQIWANVLAFALQIESKKTDVRLFTNWVDAGELSEKEMLENLLLKKELGIDDETLFTEAGYGTDAIVKILAAKQAKADAVIQGFNAGTL